MTALTTAAAPPVPAPVTPIKVTLTPNTPYQFVIAMGGLTYTINAMFAASATGGVSLAVDTGAALTTDAGGQIQED